LEKIEGRDNYDFHNLPILSIPYFDFGGCELCELWTNPKLWNTTPETWDYGIEHALREWQFT